MGDRLGGFRRGSLLMHNQRDEGLGFSLLVYVGALLAGLLLFVGPVLWAYSPAVIPNAELPKYDITSSRPLARQNDKIPLAVLKREDIVDQKTLASLGTQPSKPAKGERAVASGSRNARTAYAQAHDDDDTPAQQRPRRSFGFFGLF
jgi:hypothetical protein